MNKVDQKILTRLQELIQLGQKVLSTRQKGYPPTAPGEYHSYQDKIDIQLAGQWGVSCLNLMGRVFGKTSDHYTKFDGLYTDFIKPLVGPTVVTHAFGILVAAKDDYENGYLFETRALIEAEVFDGFLEQAEYLYNSGYHAPAAVIAGGILEDGLRKLCQRSGITLPTKVTIDPMNVELAKVGVYNTLTQKKVTMLADIRNKAAHAKWNEFTKEDVEDMISQIRSFMEKHFA